MDLTIKEIISEVKSENPNLSSLEIERIFDSQFCVLEHSIRNRTKKTINIMYIGKIKPSKWFLDNYDKMVEKIKTDISGLEE